jgi:phage terminase small subunit
LGGMGSGGRRHKSSMAMSLIGKINDEVQQESMTNTENVVTPPSWLQGIARESFETHAGRLQAAQMITARDTGALVVAAVCEAVAATILEKRDLLPAERSELRQWLALYRLALGDLGITPAARNRVDKIHETPDDDDPLEAILNGDFRRNEKS